MDCLADSSIPKTLPFHRAQRMSPGNRLPFHCPKISPSLESTPDYPTQLAGTHQSHHKTSSWILHKIFLCCAFLSFFLLFIVSAFITLILDVQNFGSVFLRSNFWYQCNLRCYWQSQMLHCKIRSTLASEVFHKKYYALPKHLRFLRALWYSYWMSHMYFDTSKQR